MFLLVETVQSLQTAQKQALLFRQSLIEKVRNVRRYEVFDTIASMTTRNLQRQHFQNSKKDTHGR